jgi:hypothetical protein
MLTFDLPHIAPWKKGGKLNGNISEIKIKTVGTALLSKTIVNFLSR